MSRTRNFCEQLLIRCLLMGMLAFLLLRGGGTTAVTLALSCGQWNLIPNPAGRSALIEGVTILSANDVWAVGFGGGTYTQHWNGKQWRVVPSPNPSGVGVSAITFLGVTAISTTDVWAVGSYNKKLTNNTVATLTLTEHWDGTQWSIIPSPNPPGSPRNHLKGVAAISSNDVWAVGIQESQSPQMLTEHWDGTQWSIIPSPNPPALFDLPGGVAAIATNDVWDAGSYDDSNSGDILGLIEHWDGSQWSIVPNPSPSGATAIDLNGVAAISSHDIWVVGDFHGPGIPVQTLTEHWDGTQWKIIPSPNPSGSIDSELLGVAASSASDIWAVGDAENSRGVFSSLTELYC